MNSGCRMNNNLNYLIVEDNSLDIEKFRRCFKKLGRETRLFITRDGIEALAALRGESEYGQIPKPFVILLDLNLPRMNGIEFLHEIRDDDDFKHIPVIMLTTSDRRQDIKAAFQHNVAGYMVKPAKLKDMEHMVNCIEDYFKLCQHP